MCRLAVFSDKLTFIAILRYRWAAEEVRHLALCYDS